MGKTQRKLKFQKSHYDVANSKSSTTMWLISKSHYDVANLMSHYNVANSKAATMRHYLQSPLLHGNILQNLKIIFRKAQKCLFDIYFYKAQILIWHLFVQSPNSNLALFLQSPNTNLALFYKVQILFWQFFHKA